MSREPNHRSLRKRKSVNEIISNFKCTEIKVQTELKPFLLNHIEKSQQPFRAGKTITWKHVTSRFCFDKFQHSQVPVT
jgi:hypothetical protein